MKLFVFESSTYLTIVEYTIYLFGGKVCRCWKGAPEKEDFHPILSGVVEPLKSALQKTYIF